MKRLTAVFTIYICANVGLVAAQDAPLHSHAEGQVRDTVGLISEEVAKQRLEMQGYTNVQVKKKDASTLEITASKENAPVVLEMHRHHGTVSDVTSSRMKPIERERVPRIPGQPDR
ncbi:MAG: hypothetical protein CV088_00405 [Nitrospira sp. LK70]|nr:hypothetical protein [Nitrospira sp. LK70]